MTDTNGTNGLCGCGCRGLAPIATVTCKRLGYVKGRLKRFINGHQCRKGPNPVVHLPNGTSVLTIKRKEGPDLECSIETSDYPLVEGYRWCAQKSQHGFYVRTSLAGGGSLGIHQLLLPDCEDVDHEDHNPLNNRRKNLRPATRSQNRQNANKSRTATTSKFKGVCWNKEMGKFQACICVSGTRINLGHFDSEEEAGRVWNEAAKKHHGAFACLNTFPEEVAA